MSVTSSWSSRPWRLPLLFTFILALAVLTPTRFATGAGQAGAVRILPAPAAHIIGVVYLDADQDGEQDLTENGLAGAELSLYGDANGDGRINVGEALLARTSSHADGAYIFRDCLPGDYVVLITIPPGAGPTTPVALAVHLVTGEISGAAYDFGAYQAGGLRLSFPSLR